MGHTNPVILSENLSSRLFLLHLLIIRFPLYFRNGFLNSSTTCIFLDLTSAVRPSKRV